MQKVTRIYMQEQQTECQSSLNTMHYVSLERKPTPDDE